MSKGEAWHKLEEEAKASAHKKVAGWLQRPEQLEKVDQYKRQVAKRKATIEHVLKSTVQSQLDGIRDGLDKLHVSLQQAKDIDQNILAIQQMYETIQPVRDKLQNLKKATLENNQLSSAMEHLKHIFGVPDIVDSCHKCLDNGELLQAHKHLMDLENSRDELLFEIHRQTASGGVHGSHDAAIVTRYFRDIPYLQKKFEDAIKFMANQCLVAARTEPHKVVTIARILDREEASDKRYLELSLQGFTVEGRPKGYYKLFDEQVQNQIANRIEASQIKSREESDSWLIIHLEQLRRFVIEDLRVVQLLLPRLFPPHLRMVETYLKTYHFSLSTHIIELMGQELQGNEHLHLLAWVSKYRGEELMGHPELQIDLSQLQTELLPEAYVKELEEQYVATVNTNIKQWMKKALEREVKDWDKGNEPDEDNRGHYQTSYPQLIFQMVEENLHVASTLNNRNTTVRMLMVSFDEMLNNMDPLFHELKQYKARHLAEPQRLGSIFTHYVIAVYNNFAIFTKQVKNLRDSFARTDVDIEHGVDSRHSRLTKRFEDGCRECCSLLADEVFHDIDKYLQNLLTKLWLATRTDLDTILATLNDYYVDYVHLFPDYLAHLTKELATRITIEYLKAILQCGTGIMTKKMSFKTQEERNQMADKIIAEAKELEAFLVKRVTHADGASPLKSLKDVAEVFKQSDPTMLSFEISTLIHKHTDMRILHVQTLIAARGDVSKSDARQMAIDIMGEDADTKHKPKGLFTTIQL